MEDYEKWDRMKREVLTPLMSLSRNLRNEEWAEVVQDIEERGYAEEFREYIQPYINQLFQGLAAFPGPFVPKKSWHKAKVTLPEGEK